MLVDQDRVAVRVDHHEAGRPGAGLVGLGGDLDSLRLELALELPDVGELIEARQAGVDRWLERREP